MKKLVRKAEGGVAMTPITQNMQLAPMIQQSQQLQPVSNGFDVSQLIQGFTNGQGGIGQKIGQGLGSALQGTKFAQSGFSNFASSAKGGLVSAGINLATSFLPGADYSGAKREALAKGLDKGYDAVETAQFMTFPELSSSGIFFRNVCGDIRSAVDRRFPALLWSCRQLHSKK